MHFEKNDYQLQTEFSFCGYKRYWDPQRPELDILLCEVKLNSVFEIPEFSDYNRNTMLWSLMYSLVNMVPVNIIDVFKSEAEYDFF